MPCTQAVIRTGGPSGALASADGAFSATASCFPVDRPVNQFILSSCPLVIGRAAPGSGMATPELRTRPGQGRIQYPGRAGVVREDLQLLLFQRLDDVFCLSQSERDNGQCRICRGTGGEDGPVRDVQVGHVMCSTELI